MNTVYLLERDIPYEGNTIKSVHSTLSKAVEALADIAMSEGPMGFAYTVNYHIYSMETDGEEESHNHFFSVGDSNFFVRGADSDVKNFTNLTHNDIVHAINTNMEHRKEYPHTTLSLCNILYYMEQFNIDYDTAYRWYAQADEKWWKENY